MLKKVITSILLGLGYCCTITAHAAQPGLYLSGQLGYADTHMKGKAGYFWNSGEDPTILTGLTNSGIAGRIALGYQFNPYFALEAGYLNVFGGPSYTTKIKTKHPFYKFQLKQSVIDLAAKGILPLNEQVSVYGKVGAAYLTTSLDNRSTTDSETHYDLPLNIARRCFAPEASIGMSYNLNQKASIDLSATRIQPFGKNKPQPINFFAVGLAYNIG